MADFNQKAADNADVPRPIIRNVWSWQRRQLEAPLVLMIVPTGHGEGHNPGEVVDMKLSEFTTVLETKKWGEHELTDSDIELLKQGLKRALKNQPDIKEELVAVYDEVTKLEQKQKEAELLKKLQSSQHGTEPKPGLT